MNEQQETLYVADVDMPDGFRPFKNRIAELEQNPERKAALDKARERLHHIANAGKMIEPEIAPDGRIAKTVFTLEDIQKASDMGRAAGALEMRDAAVRVVHRFISGDGLAEPFMSDIAEAIAALPNLWPVINWLENGCDPKEAAKELRIYESQRGQNHNMVQPMALVDAVREFLREGEEALDADEWTAMLVSLDAWHNLEAVFNEYEYAAQQNHSGEPADMVQEPVECCETYGCTKPCPKYYTTQPTAALVARQMRDAAVNVVKSEASQYAEPVWAVEIINDILELHVPEVQWIDLTDSEIELNWSHVWDTGCQPWAIDFARAVIAKFKEKQL